MEKAPRYGVLGRYTASINDKDWNSIKQNVTQSSFTIHSQRIVSRKKLWWNLKKLFARSYRCHLDLLQRSLEEWIGFRSRWKQQRHPTNPTKTQNPIIKNGETRRWRYLVWSRGRQALNKNGETRMWIRIHKKLRVDTYKNWRRSNKNGETRKGGGTWHWLQSTRTVTRSCRRSRTSPSSRACKKNRKSSSSRSTSSRLAAE